MESLAFCQIDNRLCPIIHSFNERALDPATSTLINKTVFSMFLSFLFFMMSNSKPQFGTNILIPI